MSGSLSSMRLLQLLSMPSHISGATGDAVAVASLQSLSLSVYPLGAVHASTVLLLSPNPSLSLSRKKVAPSVGLSSTVPLQLSSSPLHCSLALGLILESLSSQSASLRKPLLGCEYDS